MTNKNHYPHGCTIFFLLAGLLVPMVSQAANVTVNLSDLITFRRTPPSYMNTITGLKGGDTLTISYSHVTNSSEDQTGRSQFNNISQGYTTFGIDAYAAPSKVCIDLSPTTQHHATQQLWGPLAPQATSVVLTVPNAPSTTPYVYFFRGFGSTCATRGNNVTISSIGNVTSNDVPAGAAAGTGSPGGIVIARLDIGVSNCAAETANNVNWPATPANTTVDADDTYCVGGYVAPLRPVKRLCNASGVWETPEGQCYRGVKNFGNYLWTY